MPKFPFISHRGTTFKTSEFLVKIPVTGQTGPVNRSNRSVYWSEPVTHVLLNLDLNSTGFRSNRSGKPLPEVGSLTGPVGFVNPAWEMRCQSSPFPLSHRLSRRGQTAICSVCRALRSFIHSGKHVSVRVYLVGYDM